MSRPLVVTFLLLTTIANAAVMTQVNCGFSSSCEGCVENKKTEPLTEKLGECMARVSGTETEYYTFECDVESTVKKVLYYDDKCKIEKSRDSANDHVCKASAPYGSVSLKKTTGNEFEVKYCRGSSSCDSGDCISATITSLSGGCTNTGSFSYKARRLATGDDVLSITGYSGTGCEKEKLEFQDVFVADGKCNPLSSVTKWTCDAPAHTTAKACGFVESCGACRETIETSRTPENKCINGSHHSISSSSKATCSDGKSTITSYTDDSCTEKKSTTTTESCIYDTSEKYVKFYAGSLYMCSSLDSCQGGSHSCDKRTPSAPLSLNNECVYDKNEGFSYKASKAGDGKSHITVFEDNRCEKGLIIQGEFGSECVRVRNAQKTQCSGSLVTTTVLATSVIVAAISLLL